VAPGESRDEALDHFVTLYGGVSWRSRARGEELDEYERRVEDELKKFG
jgi:hypothetical protein